MDHVHDIARRGEVQRLRAALDADPGLIEAESTTGRAGWGWTGYESDDA